MLTFSGGTHDPTFVRWQNWGILAWCGKTFASRRGCSRYLECVQGFGSIDTGASLHLAPLGWSMHRWVSTLGNRTESSHFYLWTIRLTVPCGIESRWGMAHFNVLWCHWCAHLERLPVESSVYMKNGWFRCCDDMDDHLISSGCIASLHGEWLAVMCGAATNVSRSGACGNSEFSSVVMPLMHISSGCLWNSAST